MRDGLVHKSMPVGNVVFKICAGLQKVTRGLITLAFLFCPTVNCQLPNCGMQCTPIHNCRSKLELFATFHTWRCSISLSVFNYHARHGKGSVWWIVIHSYFTRRFCCRMSHSDSCLPDACTARPRAEQLPHRSAALCLQS